MLFSQNEIEEFKTEATEMLDESESQFLLLEKGCDFSKSYDAIFRVFHSLKGGAGMLNQSALQTHMHQIETQFQQCKTLEKLSKEYISYFLSAIDCARQILNGNDISFTYQMPSEKKIHTSVTKTAIKNTTGKVIIIDDEPDIVEYLVQILERSNFSTCGFTSPQKALQSIECEKPDVVLTDIKMPELSGFDILKEVNKKNPDLPVVFISGFITKELIIDSLSYGVFSALEKPFEDARVIEICTNAIHRHQLVQLMNNIINFIYYQYSDLEQYLKYKGGEALSLQMQTEFRKLIEAKRKLKYLKRAEL